MKQIQHKITYFVNFIKERWDFCTRLGERLAVSSYRESLKSPHVHHIIRILWDYGRTFHSVIQGCDDVVRTIRQLRIGQYLFHQKMIFLNSLYGLDQQISQLKPDEYIIAFIN